MQSPSAGVICPGLVWTVTRGHARCHARRSGGAIKVRSAAEAEWMAIFDRACGRLTQFQLLTLQAANNGDQAGSHGDRYGDTTTMAYSLQCRKPPCKCMKGSAATSMMRRCIH